MIVLFYCFFEVYFLFVQMIILVVVLIFYVWVIDGVFDVYGVNWMFSICNILCIVGFMEVVLYFFFYESFYKVCFEICEKEMSDVGLIKGMYFFCREVKINFIDYIMVFFVVLIFGLIFCV